MPREIVNIGGKDFARERVIKENYGILDFVANDIQKLVLFTKTRINNRIDTDREFRKNMFEGRQTRRVTKYEKVNLPNNRDTSEDLQIE